MKTFHTQSIQQSINGRVRFDIGGTFFLLVSCTVALDVEFYEKGRKVGTASQFTAGIGIKDTPFDRVEIITGSADTVKFIVADGEVVYNQFSGSVTATIVKPTTLANVTPVSVGVVETVLLAANAARKGARFYNNGTADVFLGPTGVTTTNGCVRIAPGQMWVEDEVASAAWFAISAVAGQDVRIQEVS